MCGPATTISSLASLAELLPRRRRRSLVDVENRGGDLGMLQLDAQCMARCRPNKQDFFVPLTKFIAGMSRGMTRQRDELHAADDCSAPLNVRTYRP